MTDTTTHLYRRRDEWMDERNHRCRVEHVYCGKTTRDGPIHAVWATFLPDLTQITCQDCVASYIKEKGPIPS